MPTTVPPKAVGKALGLKLEEVKNWNCCGAMEVKNIDPKIQTLFILARDVDCEKRNEA